MVTMLVNGDSEEQLHDMSLKYCHDDWDGDDEWKVSLGQHARKPWMMCVANADVLTEMFALAGHPVAVHLRPQV